MNSFRINKVWCPLGKWNGDVCVKNSTGVCSENFLMIHSQQSTHYKQEVFCTYKNVQILDNQKFPKYISNWLIMHFLTSTQFFSSQKNDRFFLDVWLCIDMSIKQIFIKYQIKFFVQLVFAIESFVFPRPSSCFPGTLKIIIKIHATSDT